MTTDGKHTDSNIGSLRTGLLVLVVCLVAGLMTSRLLRRDHEPQPLTIARPAMGTVVEITIPGTDDEVARETAALAAQAALAEVARIDSLFSWLLPRPAQMSADDVRDERCAVLEVGLEVQRLSGGAFDTRMMPLVALWGFDGDEPRVPEDAALADVVAELAALGAPRDAVELESRPEALHFGAWAKGYAVDRAVVVLQERGQVAGLVNAGGEVRGYGNDWRVGVQHPRMPGALVASIEPGTLAVATSGDYEQFFEQDGRRYHHVLDPRDGRPSGGCRSVTILARSCARADALATAVFVLGPQEGMDLVERLVDVEGLIIDAAGERHESSGMDAYLSD